LLPTLAADMRRQYEEYARLQAVKMAGQHTLYPESIDQSALVETRLRDALPEQNPEEVVLSPFYVGLDAQQDG